jgi:hypothetical protein
MIPSTLKWQPEEKALQEIDPISGKVFQPRQTCCSPTPDLKLQ